MIEIECPICGIKGEPSFIAKHFHRMHNLEYQMIREYLIKYNQGWICKICGKDFLFFTSAYKHVVEEHLSSVSTNGNTNDTKEVIERW